jgi:hypothetical protein
MLTNHGLPWDEFTTKHQVQELMESRPSTDKQRAFMDDWGIAHFDGMTTKEASDVIDAQLSKETPNDPGYLTTAHADHYGMWFCSASVRSNKVVVSK